MSSMDPLTGLRQAVDSPSCAVNEAPLIGSHIADRYHLLEVIGDGGMGRVYRAQQLATGEAVAVKVLHSEFANVAEVVRRFQREARVMTELSHPSIVKVIELGEWKGHLFLAMELLGGKSLAELIGRDGKGARPMTVKRTLAIMRPVLEALAYAHERGVIHRDLKPENIMVVPGRGLLSHETIKLLDFGIAKLGNHSGQAAQKLTQQGLILGTPDYMSPEQAVGQEADVRSDLYSCGVILYEMLTGHKPFEAGSSLDVLLMHVNTRPNLLRVVAPDAVIPPGIERAILRLLAKRPGERFQNVRELREALDNRAAAEVSGAAVSAVAPTIVAQAPPRRSSRRWALIPVAIIAGAMATLVAHRLRPELFTGTPIASAAEGAKAPAAPGSRSARERRPNRQLNKQRHGRP
jgi:serine/threonine protein kinase